MTRMLTASLVTLGHPDRVSGGYLYHRRMADAGPAHGFSVEFYCFPEWPFPLPIAAGPSLLRRAASADVVIVDSIAAAYLGPWAPAARRPIVAVLHQEPGGMEGSTVRRRAQAPLDRLLYDRADLLIIASQALADAVREGGLRGEMVVVAPGCDAPEAGAGPVPELRQGRATALLCVGNWVERKGILDLLDAFARLPEEAATLHLIGDPEADRGYGARVRARLARPDLSDRVVVHGALSRSTVARFYEGADAFVLASTVEPYGTVYGEALAAGLPVVGWRAGNLPHLAQDGEEGLVVPTGDVDALSAALLAIASDGELRARLAAGARARGVALPRWADSAAAFFSAVRDVVRP
jgi:glycosyltransferase involved in cell wall biosynthesis